MTLRQGVKVALLNTQKQIEGNCQIEDTKKDGPNERTEHNPEKELNEMQITNLSDAEFETLVIRMLTELLEDGNHIKQTQGERTVT